MVPPAHHDGPGLRILRWSLLALTLGVWPLPAQTLRPFPLDEGSQGFAEIVPASTGTGLPASTGLTAIPIQIAWIGSSIESHGVTGSLDSSELLEPLLGPGPSTRVELDSVDRLTPIDLLPTGKLTPGAWIDSPLLTPGDRARLHVERIVQQVTTLPGSSRWSSFQWLLVTSLAGLLVGFVAGLIASRVFEQAELKAILEAPAGEDRAVRSRTRRPPPPGAPIDPPAAERVARPAMLREIHGGVRAGSKEVSRRSSSPPSSRSDASRGD